MGEKETLAMLLTETQSNRDFYEAIAATDPNFGFDSDASSALAVFKATGQACPQTNTALHAMQTIMIDDPNEDRTDPTYVVDFTQLHCSKYELRLMRQLANEYQDIFATHKYDLGLAKVDPVDIVTTDETPVTSKYLQIPIKCEKKSESMRKRCFDQA